jgi:hypothetical protein
MDHHRPAARKKRVTDLFWRLDCTALARDGVFTFPGNRGRISRSNPRTGEILIQADYLFAQYKSEGPSLRLVIPAGSAKPPITIKLTTTDVHFGGRRSWFLCPSCGRRARILYSDELVGPFLCRLCHSLAYQTQLLHAPQRGLLAALKVRQRFDGSSIGSPFPLRPRGMHWYTHWRHWAKERKAAKLYRDYFRAQFERLDRSNKRLRGKAVRHGWMSG